MVRGVVEALRGVVGARDVLDVWCGSRPYDDLLPAGANCVGLDVQGNPYGVADVVSDELLPFEDSSFDLLVCIQSFQYIPEPEGAVSEFRRVLRRGGMALVGLPFAFEYEPRTGERRYTAPQLAALFDGWDDVEVRESGGRAVTWTVLTASLVRNLELRTPRALRPPFSPVYVLLNRLGLLLARIEERQEGGAGVFPSNLVLTARRGR